MKIHLLALAASLSCSAVAAQDMPHAALQQTTAPVNAKYEIVQSPLAARETFKLNRFTGAIAQLVENPMAGTSWDQMYVESAPKSGTNAHPHFQIFTSGILVRATFLLDTDSGQTWQLVKGTIPLSDGTTTFGEMWEPCK